MDEKSHIQTLQRTQPGLPMKKGHCGTTTHDYKRHGTITLFAASTSMDGRVIECMARHRHQRQEFLRFLRQLGILQREATASDRGQLWNPKPAQGKGLTRKHTRFVLHFTPTSSSWLNLVERWFREMTEKHVRRGNFGSVPELIHAIDEYLTMSNAAPKPLVWKASAQAMLDKLAGCKAV